MIRRRYNIQGSQDISILQYLFNLLHQSIDQLSSNHYIWIELTIASAIGLVLLPSSPIQSKVYSSSPSFISKLACNSPRSEMVLKNDDDTRTKAKMEKIGESIQFWIRSSLKELDILQQQKLTTLPSCFMFSPGILVSIESFSSYFHILLFNWSINMIPLIMVSYNNDKDNKTIMILQPLLLFLINHSSSIVSC